jgi:hypothetical protein
LSINSSTLKNFARLKLKVRDGSNKLFFNYYLEGQVFPFKLRKFLMSSSFTFYGQNLFVGFLSDPMSIFAMRELKRAPSSTPRLSDKQEVN